MLRPPSHSSAVPPGTSLSRPALSGFRRSAQDMADLLSSTAIALNWMMRLRWHAVAGQALSVVIATKVFELDLPVFPLLLLVATTGVSNLLLMLWLRRDPVVHPHHMGVVLAFDTVLLTALLSLSGGPDNPFGMLYLLHVALAALVLGPRWTVFLACLAVLGPALLLLCHIPLREAAHAIGGVPAGMRHTMGMWVAFTLTVLLIALMVARVSGALRDRNMALVRTQLLAARAERLASLSTLAAGAAHELGSPLGTIAIAANELEALILEDPQQALEDARLIRDQVERCRDILERMSARAGQAAGELPEPTTTSVVLGRLREQLGAGELARVRFDTSPDLPLFLPTRGLVQVLANLVRNGLQASESGQAPVSVRVLGGEGGRARFLVEDQGAGIAADLLPRLGEPFFTTKAPGQGMGLGLFLSQTFAALCGGRLELASEPGKGTCVMLELPCRKESLNVAA
ncbi:ATP-binding protein [Myxococcus sp. K15C18031901]|uniref:ATP-binding protein n=1 Tax=Myxococcus dinghuensis TaxID=2906761 RepID=UPI0020A7BC47|nr:ATP-binding protein [Myxococcus dinghuensis]MCP3101537.1 ATP-binding protein [Myxococcus dinghuensis]